MDIGLLEFAQGLFLRIAPNTTAWAHTLEDFLKARRYQMSGQVSSVPLCFWLFSLRIGMIRTHFEDGSETLYCISTTSA